MEEVGVVQLGGCQVICPRERRGGRDTLNGSLLWSIDMVDFTAILRGGCLVASYIESASYEDIIRHGRLTEDVLCKEKRGG